MNKRMRSVLIAGVSLVSVGAIGTVWATSSSAAAGRYVTAVAATGDVSQSFWATGTVSRENQVDATFSVTGTVKKLKVGVGDVVAAGDVLATLDTAALKLALLNAQTDLASAKATLYAAEHPSSSSSRGSSSVTLPAGGSGTSGGSGGTSVPSGITATDAARLYQAIAAVNVATQKWSNPDQPTTCDLIYAALLNANEQTTDPGEQPDPGTDNGSGNADDGGTGSDDSGSQAAGDAGDSGDTDNPGDTPDPDDDSDAGTGDSGDADSGDPDSGTSGNPADSSATDSSDTEDDSGDTTQLALVVDDITLDDIRACGEAREELLLANAVLADYYQQLIATGTIGDGDDSPATPAPSTPASTSSRGSSGSSKASGSSTVSVSARAVAAAEADVLRNQQAVDAAEAAVANAELVAPISGTVGAISLEKGASSSAGSVTIVGEGTALVSIEVPLASRGLLSQGMAATVTPAGSARALAGTVSQIAVLETSGTAGDNPTYTTTIAVDDPDLALKSGAAAGIEIVTGTANSVVTVPASAVTPTGTGTGTVGVVDSTTSETAETVTVSTGAVGGGRVEITDGLQEGQIVVLSDRNASIDSLTSSSGTANRRGVSFGLPR